jgi:hypothetical protein
MRTAVDDRGRLADVVGESERRRHPVYLAERLLQVALFGVSRAEALVPRAQSLHLLALIGRQGVAVGVLVLPADVRRQPLVVHHVRRRRADAGLLVLLRGVERAPLWTVVYLVLLDDEAAVLPHRLAPSVVGGEVRRPALGTAKRLLVFRGVFLLSFAGVLTRARTPRSVTSGAFSHFVGRRKWAGGFSVPSPRTER